MPSIAVDVMSGDSGAPECIPGALRALATDPALELILVGRTLRHRTRAGRNAPAAVRARLSVHPAATVVGMSEHPREAIRRRKDSSMRIAIDLVKEGRAGAMVSAGNTGALTAMAHFVLKTVGPVERAPIMSSVPARNGGHTHILDLGANTKATALQLAQFATMGSIVARDVFGIATPRVGLLNIGEEDTKGHELDAGSARADSRERRELSRLRRRQSHLRRERRRGGHRWLHRQRRAQGDGRPRQAHRRTAAHGILARYDQQDFRVASPPGTAARRRETRSAALQRRLHGRTDRSRGKKPRQRGQRRIRPGRRHGRHRDAPRVCPRPLPSALANSQV